MRFSQTLHLLSNKGRIENNGGGKRCVELEKLSAVREKELVSFLSGEHCGRNGKRDYGQCPGGTQKASRNKQRIKGSF